MYERDTQTTKKGGVKMGDTGNFTDENKKTDLKILSKSFTWCFILMFVFCSALGGVTLIYEYAKYELGILLLLPIVLFIVWLVRKKVTIVID